MKRVLTLIVVGLFFGVAAACGTGGSSAGDGGTSSATVTKFKVGEPMKSSDGRTVTVLSFKRGFSTGNEFEVPKSGNEFVQVTYALSNGSKSEWSQPLFELSLIDTNGQKHQQTFVTGQSSVDSLIAGGKAPSATQVYEVPTGAAVDVAWTPNIFENTVLQTPLG